MARSASVASEAPVGLAVASARIGAAAPLERTRGPDPELRVHQPGAIPADDVPGVVLAHVLEAAQPRPTPPTRHTTACDSSLHMLAAQPLQISAPFSPRLTQIGVKRRLLGPSGLFVQRRRFGSRRSGMSVRIPSSAHSVSRSVACSLVSATAASIRTPLPGTAKISVRRQHRVARQIHLTPTEYAKRTSTRSPEHAIF